MHTSYVRKASEGCDEVKIEKINDNQIRCTLSKTDLADRQLRISELAYGTDKAKALFREMMQQASDELGFEADDIPLMIEAIPVSSECLILVITKVEAPDELDTRFSKFSPEQSDDSEIGDSEEAYVDEIINCFDQINQLLDGPQSAKQGDDVLSFPQSKDSGPENNSSLQSKSTVTTSMTKVFSFVNLHEIVELSSHLSQYYSGENQVYKNPQTCIYYLCISKSQHTPEEFNKICNIISEYGMPEKTTYATLEYYKEHFDCIIKSDAVEILSAM